MTETLDGISRSLLGSRLEKLSVELTMIDRRGSWRLYRTADGRHVKTCDRDGEQVVVEIGETLHDPSAGAESVLLTETPPLPTDGTRGTNGDDPIVHDGKRFRATASAPSGIVVASGDDPGTEFVLVSPSDRTRIVVERDGSRFLVVHYDHGGSRVRTLTAFVTPEVQTALAYVNAALDDDTDPERKFDN